MSGKEQHKLLHQPTDATIATSFLKIGSRAYGGWSTTVVLLEQEISKQVFGSKTIKLQPITTYAQLLPGATQVAIVSGVGYQLKGIRGAVIATISYLFPAMSLIILFAAIYFRFLQSADIINYMGGLVAALSGVILANAYKIGSKHVSHPFFWIFVIVAAGMQLWLHVQALLILMVYGGIGLFLTILQARQARS